MTVFLALSALSLFALFSVCLESARYACLDYLCSQAADSSLKSVFAAFQGDMVRDYGLLMCRGKEGEEEIWTESFREYAEKYWQPGGERAYGDRLRLKELEVQALDSVYITEGHGRVFSNEVLTYMKTAGLSVLLKEALERMGLYQEEEGEGFLETIQNMLGDKDGSLDGILDSYKNIKEQAKELQEKARKEAEEGDEEYQPPPGNSEDVKTDLLEQIKA
ncbi:MAG: hypothetical protein J6H18_05695, partial [Lachnospiraceae bacterium]|nr:hypothetical protein [Lachnospiraceae bacterium]